MKRPIVNSAADAWTSTAMRMARRECHAKYCGAHRKTPLRSNSRLHQKNPQKRNFCPALYRDRKSTRLNSSHEWISYAVFCLKKKKKKKKKKYIEYKQKNNTRKKK